MPKFVEDDEIIDIKAIKEFTDREEPRKVFWDKYNKVLNEMNQNGKNPIQVISYYGFGGIGKSALLHKLHEEVNQKAPNSKIEFVDFEKLVEFNNNLLDILRVIRQDLKDNYKFTFPIFDLVTYVYETKMGKTATKPELNSIFNENKELNFLKDVIGEIPLIGTFSKIIYYADEGKNLIKDRLKNSKLRQRLLDIENKSPEEIKSHLAYYFSLDLKENLKNETAPFIFFIDTYEKLVNELTQIGDPLNNDLWLRSDEGLICRVPNVIWVIAGREKLRWQELDETWDGTLEQHLLGTLSFQDTSQFLKVAGIQNEDLIHQIYDLTHGTPMYLDMCVDTYVKLKEKGKEPVIDDFGTDTTKLVKRFLMYMNDTERDFSTMLAYITDWTDSNIEAISKKMNGSFSFSLYEKVKKFSFVVNENGKYKMHESIRDIIIANTPEMVRLKYQRIIQEETNNKIENATKIENERINEILKDKRLDNESKEASQNEQLAYIDNYESQNMYNQIIQKLYSEVLLEENEKDFEEKAKFLLEKIAEYEEKFNREISFDKFASIKCENSKYAKLLQVYYKYHTYHIGLRPEKFEEEYNDLKSLFGEYSEEALLPIKHYLRWKVDSVREKEKLNNIFEIITTNMGKKNLYYITLCSLCDYNNLGRQQEFVKMIREYPTTNANKFYIKLILDASYQSTIDLCLMEKYNESFNEFYTNYDCHMEEVKKEGIYNFSIAIRVLKENPNLLDATVLYKLSQVYTSYHLFYESNKENPLDDIIFDYIYSIRHIALNTSNQEIIDCFLRIFKNFIGGEENSKKLIVKDKEKISKTLNFLMELKEHYEELYGKDHFNVNEIEDYINKFDKLTPDRFNTIMKSRIEKYGLTDNKTKSTFLTYIHEISNISIENDCKKTYFDFVLNYIKDILNAHTKEEILDKSKYFEYLVEETKKCLLGISKEEYYNNIFEFNKILYTYYNDKSFVFGEHIFKDAEKILNLRVATEKSNTNQVKNAIEFAETILINNYSNGYLKELFLRYIIFDIYSFINSDSSKEISWFDYKDLLKDNNYSNNKETLEKAIIGRLKNDIFKFLDFDDVLNDLGEYFLGKKKTFPNYYHGDMNNYIQLIKDMKKLKGLYRKNKKATIIGAYAGLLEVIIYLQEGYDIVENSVKSAKTAIFKDKELIAKLERIQNFRNKYIEIYRNDYYLQNFNLLEGYDLEDFRREIMSKN